jgi:fibronectin type 3 domain-containing protein
MKAIPTAISFFCIVLICKGQPDSLQHIPVVYHVSQDSISLRWAPENYDIWKVGNKYGYSIEKYLIVSDNSIVDPPRRIGNNVLRVRPWAFDKWENFVKSNPEAVIAAQALYGEEFKVDIKRNNIIQIASVTRENEQRFSLALYVADRSFSVAKASGLAWSDSEIKPHEKYLYKISIVDSNGVMVALGSAFVSADELTKLPVIFFQKVSMVDGIITIPIDPLPYRGIYTSFFLEKSYDSIHFNAVSELPFVQLQTGSLAPQILLTDTLNERAYYRVAGRTPFGERSPYSLVISAVGKRSLSAVPFITTVESEGVSWMKISWEFPAQSNNEILGFRLERAETHAGPYAVVNDSLHFSVREAIHKSPANSNYYRIIAKGKYGDEKKSLSFFAAAIDSVAPLTPDGIIAKIDTSGNVSINWIKNQEPDIYGYRIYKAHSVHEEPSLINRDVVQTNTMTDREDLATLNRHVYYYLMAIDRTQNHSPLSKPFILTLPDHVPPQPPLFLQASSSVEGVKLTWKPSGSADVAAYKIFKKQVAEQSWSLLKKISVIDSSNSFLDRNVVEGVAIYYTMISVDSASLESMPTTPVVARQELRLKVPITLQIRSVNREDMTITLGWKNEASHAKSYQVFRREANDRFKLHKTIDGNLNQWTDHGLKPRTQYSYFMITIFNDSSLSRASDIFVVDF